MTIIRGYRLLNSLFFLVFLQSISYIVPLVSLPYLTNTLYPVNYGKLNTALTILQYIIIGTDFGFNVSSSKKISENRNDFHVVKEIFWQTIYAKSLISLVLTSISFPFIYYNESLHSIIFLYLCTFPQLIGSILFPLWYFQGTERIKSLSLLTLAGKLLSLPFLLIFVKSPQDTGYAAIILSIPLVISSMLSVPHLLKSQLLTPVKPQLLIIIDAIKSSLPFFLGNFAIYIYVLSTPIILSIVSTYNEVAYYTATDKIRGACVGIFILVGQAVYPKVIYLFKYDRKKYTYFVRMILWLIFPLSLIASLLFYICIPSIAPLLLGAEFDEINALLKMLVPMFFLIPISFILANYLIIPYGHTKGYATIPWIVSCFHIPCSIFFCKYYGAYGGNISILITEFLSFLFLTLYCVRMKLYTQT